MDTLTHAMIGALVGRAMPLPKSRSLDPGRRIMAGALCAAFPDIDYLTFWIDPLSFLSDWHRGPTHSLILLPLWALLLGKLSARLFNQQDHWRSYALIAAMALLSHVLTDLITVYGTGIFYPLSAWRPGLGITFVIDPWLSGSALLMLVLTISSSNSQSISRFGLVLLAGYIGTQAWLQQQALTVARDRAAELGLDTTATRAIAQPLSPLNWKLLVHTPEGLDIAHLRLSGNKAADLPGFAPGFLHETAAAYQLPASLSWQHHKRFGAVADDAPLAREIWRHPLLERFRRFARYPALYRIDRAPQQECVWFTDLRFSFPGMLPAFRYGLCRAGDQRDWQLYRIRRMSLHEFDPL